MYYDNELQIKKPIEYIIDDFLDNLLSLHDDRNCKEIRRLLKIKEIENDVDNNNNSNGYITVRANEHVRKTISVIRQIIAGKVFDMWIEDVLKKWNNKLNKTSSDEIELIYKLCEFRNCYESDKVINIKINDNVWSSFIVRCKRSSLKTSEGFKLAISYFIIEDTIDF